MKPCECCGGSFNPIRNRHGEQRFCSACLAKHGAHVCRKIADGTWDKKCLMCGADFHGGQKYCSNKCKDKADKQRKSIARKAVRETRKCYCGAHIGNSLPPQSKYCSDACARVIENTKRIRPDAHVLLWRRLQHRYLGKHDAHVKLFDSVATASMQARRYKARGEPWKNPKISDALRYKLKYRLDQGFRLSEINRNTWRKEILSARDDGTVNFWVLLKERKTCPYCGTKITKESAVADHMDPLKLGGANGAHNLTICCRDCNKAKAGRPYAEWVDMLPANRQEAARRWYARKHGKTVDVATNQGGLCFEFKTA